MATPRLVAALAGTTLALLAAGCATMQSTDWTGHRISEVVTRLGRPTQVTRTDDGATYVWKQTRSTVRANKGFAEPHDGFDTTAYTLVWRFSVDSDGRITSYSMERNPWFTPAP